VRDGRAPYPLSREEQALLFQELPDHLARMALFKCDDEVKVPELDTSVFIIPGDRVKNAQDRLVVLNRIARSVVEAQRGQHPDYVFAYVPKRRNAKPGEPHEGAMPVPVLHMNNSAWQSARARAADKWEEQTGTPAPEGFRRVRVHDMKPPSADAYGQRASRSSTGRTSWATRVRASRRTTRGRSLPTSSRRRR
jgi:integrase